MRGCVRQKGLAGIERAFVILKSECWIKVSICRLFLPVKFKTINEKMAVQRPAVFCYNVFGIM